MSALGSLGKFVIGGAVGTAVGMVVSSLLAPQDGKAFQEETRDRMTYAKQAGVDAEESTRSAMTERFRQRVGDRSALTPNAGVVRGKA